MAKFSKPSRIRARGTAQEQINYLINYLTTLVSELEKSIGAVTTQKSNSYITDISFSNNELVITRADSTVNKIKLR